MRYKYFISYFFTDESTGNTIYDWAFVSKDRRLMNDGDLSDVVEKIKELSEQQDFKIGKFMIVSVTLLSSPNFIQRFIDFLLRR